MNLRTTLLVALAMGLAFSASPTLAEPKIQEDASEMKSDRKTSPATRSTKPKEIVVVGSKTAKSPRARMAAWHEMVILGDVAAASDTGVAPRTKVEQRIN